MANKIIIKMPIDKAELQCEIDEDVWGCQKSCSDVLSKILTSYYQYPILVTVETDKDEIKQWKYYDSE